MGSYIVELISNVLKRVSHLELTTFLALITIFALLYTSFGYLRGVILCFRLNGPPAKFFLGHALILMDKYGKLKKNSQFQHTISHTILFRCSQFWKSTKRSIVKNVCSVCGE